MRYRDFKFAEFVEALVQLSSLASLFKRYNERGCRVADLLPCGCDENLPRDQLLRK